MIDKSLFGLPGAGRTMGILMVLALLQAGLVIGQAWAIAGAITNLWNGAAVADQLVPAIQFACCFIARQLVVFVQDTYLDTYAHARTSELREQLLERIFATQAGLVRSHGTAHTTASVLEGVDQVQTYLGSILPRMTCMVAIPLVTLVATFSLDWVSGIILLVLFPTIIFFMVLLGRQAQERAARQYGTYQVMSNHFVDTLRGIDTLKVFGASRGYGARIFEVSERFRQATIDTLKVATLSGAVLDMIATAGLAGVSIMLAFRLMGGSIALFAGLAVLVLAPEFFKPIREFASDFHASLDGKNALIDITNLVAEGKPRPTEGPEEALEGSTTVRPWAEGSSLELHDVGFRYDTEVFDAQEALDAAEQAAAGASSDRHTAQAGASNENAPGMQAGPRATTTPLALEGISLSAHGLAKVGIVGPSGSGKSTLAALLGGFNLPCEGSIEVDGTRVDSLRLPDWQHQLLYIPQDPYIFHATLRDNIAFYSPEATEAQIQHAIEALGLDSLVSQLPQGLDTIVGEGARGISGGQAQRIALARALLDPERRVLVFDEPTAHLDIETELELKARMLPLMEGRLVFFATHRLHWLDSFDWVVVLEDGRVAEQGRPAQLLAADGALARLCAQARQGEAS